MKKSPLPPRTTPLPRGPAPTRKTRIRPSAKKIRAKKANPSKRRWAKHRNDAFREWIRGLPCALTGCFSYHAATVCAHVKTRSTGGDDLGNCIPLCVTHHSFQHDVGIKSFQRFHHIDMQALAASYAERYQAECVAGRDQ